MHWLRVWFGQVIVLLSWNHQPWQLIANICPVLSLPVPLEVFAHVGRTLSACKDPLITSYSLHLQTCLGSNLLYQATKTLSSQALFMKSLWLKSSFCLTMEEKTYSFCCWAMCHNTNMLGESQDYSLPSYPPLPTCSTYNIVTLIIYLFPCVCKRATAWKSYCSPIYSCQTA